MQLRDVHALQAANDWQQGCTRICWQTRGRPGTCSAFLSPDALMACLVT